MKPTVFIASNRESVDVARALQLELTPEVEVILWSEVLRPGDGSRIADNGVPKC
jgi:hypothetical protein